MEEMSTREKHHSGTVLSKLSSVYQFIIKMIDEKSPIHDRLHEIL